MFVSLRGSAIFHAKNLTLPALYSLKTGAIGGKLLGAGGGGFLLLFVKPMDRINLINNLKEIGGEIITFQFESEGVTVWKTN